MFGVLFMLQTPLTLVVCLVIVMFRHVFFHSNSLRIYVPSTRRRERQVPDKAEAKAYTQDCGPSPSYLLYQRERTSIAVLGWIGADFG
jgi:hypothetical protein